MSLIVKFFSFDLVLPTTVLPRMVGGADFFPPIFYYFMRLRRSPVGTDISSFFPLFPVELCTSLKPPRLGGDEVPIDFLSSLFPSDP